VLASGAQPPASVANFFRWDKVEPCDGIFYNIEPCDCTSYHIEPCNYSFMKLVDYSINLLFNYLFNYLII
jgi:hypothetical protein